jgi:hypothetical protein
MGAGSETDGYLTANAPWKKPKDAASEDTHCVAGARAGNSRRGHSHHNGAGLPHPARRRRQSLAPAWTGRDRRRSKAILPHRPCVGRIESRNEVQRTRAAVSPRGEGRSGTYAKSRRRKQSQRCGKQRARRPQARMRPPHPLRPPHLRPFLLSCRRMQRSRRPTKI